MANYSGEQVLETQKRMIGAAERIPGVTAVGTSNAAPPSVLGGDETVYRQGTTDFLLSNSVFEAMSYSMSPGYLRAAGTKLLSGRVFTWHDDEKAPKVAIVNQTFARTMFGRSSAIGKPFLLYGGTLFQIVGVVQDGKYRTLTESPQPAMFFPIAQHRDSSTTLVVRSNLSAAEIAADLQRALSGVAPDVPFTIQSWQSSLGVVYFPAQVAAAALGHHGAAGGDAGGDGHLRDGGVQRVEADEGTGHSHRPRRAASTADAFRVGKAAGVAALRLGGRVNPRRTGEPTVGANCV